MSIFGFMGLKKQTLKNESIITSDEIKRALRPFLRRDVWLTDTEYSRISSSDALSFLKKIQITDKKYHSGLFECEEFSLVTIAKLREHHADLFENNETEYDLNFPIGMCSGTKFRGMAFNHTLVICICSDGVFLFEPQSGEMWLAQKNKDNFFFVWM